MPRNPKLRTQVDSDYQSGGGAPPLPELTPQEAYQEALDAFAERSRQREALQKHRPKAADQWISFKQAFLKRKAKDDSEDQAEVFAELAKTTRSELEALRAKLRSTSLVGRPGSLPVSDQDELADKIADLEATLKATERLQEDLRTRELLNIAKLHATYTAVEIESKGGPLDQVNAEIDDLTNLIEVGGAALVANAASLREAQLELCRQYKLQGGDHEKAATKSLKLGEEAEAARAKLDPLTEQLKRREARLAKAEEALAHDSLDADALSRYSAAQQAVSETQTAHGAAFVVFHRADERFKGDFPATLSEAVDRVSDLNFDNNLPANRALLQAIRQIRHLERAHKDLQNSNEDNEALLERNQHRRADLRSRLILEKERQTLLAAGNVLFATFRACPWLADVTIWAESAEALQAMFTKKKPKGVTYASFARAASAFSLSHEQMSKQGFSPEDTRKLIVEHWAGWPENWWPPRLRQQEQNWIRVRDLFEEEAAHKKHPLELFGEQALETATAYQQSVLSAAGVVIDDGTDAGVITRNVLVYVALCVDVANAGRALVSRQKSKNDDDLDPVQAMMVVEDRMSLAVKAFEGTAKNATAVLRAMPWDKIAAAAPGVGTVQKLTETLHQAHGAAERWKAAAADAAVHAKARRVGHEAEQATDYVAKRGKKLAKRDVAYTATTFMAAAGMICECAGLAAPIGLGIRAGAAVASGALSVGFTLEDMATQETAKKLLRLARAGDPDAREEIFRHHARYATAILALLAEEGDPIALSLFGNHKVTKEMAEQSSAMVLKRYLMTQMQEVDEPWALSDIVPSIAKALRVIGAALGAAKDYIKEHVEPLERIDFDDPRLKKPAIVGGSLRKVRTAVAHLPQLRREQRRADRRLKSGRPLRAAERENMQKLADLFSEATTLLREQRDISLKAVADITTTMNAIQRAQAVGLQVELLGKTRQRYVDMFKEQQKILELVRSALREPLISTVWGVRAT